MTCHHFLPRQRQTEGSQTCNVWVSRVRLTRVEDARRMQSARTSSAPLLFDVVNQTFHVWLPSLRRSAAMTQAALRR